MTTPALLLIILLPGIYAWWSGRHLLRLKDDPLLPERRQARHINIFRAELVTAGLLVYLDHAKLIPLIVLAALACGFPSRKALLGESWSFAGFLNFWLRFNLAFRGFVLLLAMTPLLVAYAGQWRWLEIGILALLLFGWVFFGLPVFITLFGAKPLADSAVTARFAAIAAQSPVPAPLLLCANFPGGKFVNAFALPYLPRSAVIFTQTLLDELQAEEADAVFAHELAHLEFLDARFVKKRIALFCVASLLALGAAPALNTLLAGTALKPLILLSIGTGLLLLLGLTVGHRKQHETEADQRAVELCGDAEALARGLERIHRLSLLPRRLSAAAESAATHPSLATRIGDIQNETSASENKVLNPVILASRQAGNFVVLAADRIYWLTGISQDSAQDFDSLLHHAATATTIVYSELRELLIKPEKNQGAQLIASSRTAQKWTLPLRREDVAAAQQALDAVDAQLYKGPIQDQRHPLLVVLFSLLITLSGVLYMDSLLLALLAAYCMLRRRLFGLVVLAMVGLASIAAELLQQPLLEQEDWTLYALLLVFSSIALIYAIWCRNKDPLPRGPELQWLALLPAVLAFADWLALSKVMLGNATPLELHQAAQHCSNSATALFGLAGLVLAAGTKHLRAWVAGLLSVIAALPLFLQSAFFSGQWIHDPFKGEIQALQWENIELAAVRDIPATPCISKLALSPQAAWYACYTIQATDPARLPGPGNLLLSDFDGKQRTELQANEIIFIDDSRLLALDYSSHDKTLKLFGHKNGAWTVQKSWNLPPQINFAKLDANPATGQWRVIGQEAYNHKEVFVIDSMVDKDAIAPQNVPPLKDGVYELPVSLAGGLLAVERKELFNDYEQYSFWTSNGKDWQNLATTSLHTDGCLSIAPGNNDMPIVCMAWRGRYAYVGLFNPKSGSINRLVQLQHLFALHRGTQQNRYLYFITHNHGITAVDTASDRAANLVFKNSLENIYEVTVSGPWLATVSSTNPQEKKLRLFKLPDAWVDAGQ